MNFLKIIIMKCQKGKKLKKKKKMEEKERMLKEKKETENLIQKQIDNGYKPLIKKNQKAQTYYVMKSIQK